LNTAAQKKLTVGASSIKTQQLTGLSCIAELPPGCNGNLKFSPMQKINENSYRWSITDLYVTHAQA